jgi:hypothetical protein
MKQANKLTNTLIATTAAFSMIGAANAAVTVVGVDTTAGGNWRTAAANGGTTSTQYGTDGYVIYALDDTDSQFHAYNATFDQNALSGGITIAVGGGITNTWSGNGNFGTMQDPNAANALTNTSLLAGVGSNDTANNNFTISRSNSSFRLTILLASGDNANLTYGSTLNDGSGAVSVTPVAHTANGLLYHTYDISAGTSDIDVSLTANNNFSAAGFAIDNLVAVPEPSSTALLGLGSLALILRRRK